MRKYQISFLILLWLLVSCSVKPLENEASPTPPAAVDKQITVMATSAPLPTLTVTPFPTTDPATAEPVPYTNLKMFNSLEGWAWDIHGVWRTSDGGFSWLNITPSDFFYFEFALNSQVAWATTAQGDDLDSPRTLVRTTDGGENWTQLTGTNWYLGAQYIFYDLNEGLVYTCTPAAGTGVCDIHETYDGGLTWAPLEFTFDHYGNPIETPGQYVYCNICGDSLFIDMEKLVLAEGNMVQYADTNFTVRTTKDKGQTWRFQSLALPEGDFSLSLVDPYKTVFFGDQEGILPVKLANDNYDLFGAAFYSTNDGGQTWNFRSLIEFSSNANGWSMMDFVNSQDLFFSCGSDLCTSQDGGFTWERISSNLSFGYEDDRPSVYEFDFTDQQTGWALAGESYDQLYLWMTVNGGKDWNILAPTLLP